MSVRTRRWLAIAAVLAVTAGLAPSSGVALTRPVTGDTAAAATSVGTTPAGETGTDATPVAVTTGEGPGANAGEVPASVERTDGLPGSAPTPAGAGDATGTRRTSVPSVPGNSTAATTTATVATSGQAPTPAPNGHEPTTDDGVPTATTPTDQTPSRYILTLSRSPVASYAGGIAGIAPTEPSAGTTLALGDDNARRYAELLTTDQSAVATALGVVAKTSYTVTLNGFSADLTPLQARRATRIPGVVAVTPDRRNHLRNDTSAPDFLGLTGDGGVWAGLGGAGKAGSGVVIGVIDSGIWPESASFSGAPLRDGPDPYHPTLAYRDGTTTVMTKADGSTFTGECQAGEDFTASLCNTKIISARYFADGFLEANPGQGTPNDYLSPRDHDGHGTHTAGTAAGDADVPVSIGGVDYGTISGVAPGASIAVYKALWQGPDGDVFGGADSDLIAAIEQAVVDGVDVLNYSAGRGTESPADDPVGLALRSAAAAGIFVAAGAGNDGPTASTSDNTQPWETTVAASTLGPREGTVVLGDGQSFSGASSTVRAALGPVPLIAGRLSGLPGTSSDNAAICAADVLDPAKVAGAVVQCDRGGVDRTAKSAEVARAGGVGMVLTDIVAGSTDSDLHSLPTVHVDMPGGPVIQAYAATPGATVTLLPGNTTGLPTPYPQVAASSSRGPALSAAGDVLKPDLAAPGVSILGPVAPPANRGRSFDFYSGTSMATPHVAGLAALYAAGHPDWSPMAIKSALMTTASDTRNPDGTADADPFAQGAGEVDPRRMFEPGLVYDAGPADWSGYLEGLGVDTGTGVAPIAATDYNQASIAVGKAVGPTTVTRRVTAVAPGTYVASAAVPGFDTVVTPTVLDFTVAGEEHSFTVTLTRTTALLGTFATGFLTWTASPESPVSGTPVSVRSPIAVRPVLVGDAPAQVVMDDSGTATWTVRSGVSGTFPIAASGMTGGDPQRGQVSEFQTRTYTVDVPAGTNVARFSTQVADAETDAEVDISVSYQPTGGDPVVYDDVDTSGAENAIDIVRPAAGRYQVQVIGFFDASGTNATPYTFRHYLVQPLDPGAPGALTVQDSLPTTQAGDGITVTARASGMTPGEPYLGWLEYGDGSGTLVTAPADR